MEKLQREERQADKRAKALEQMLEEAGREKGEAEVKLSGTTPLPAHTLP